MWTGTGQPPWELTELRLCRDVYHCLPSQLDEEDWDRIQAHLECMAMENRTRT